MFPCLVKLKQAIFSFVKRVAEKLERINEGQITRESVEEILSYGNTAELCPKEFVAEKLPKLRIL